MANAGLVRFAYADGLLLAGHPLSLLREGVGQRLFGVRLGGVARYQILKPVDLSLIGGIFHLHGLQLCLDALVLLPFGGVLGVEVETLLL